MQLAAFVRMAAASTPTAALPTALVWKIESWSFSRVRTTRSDAWSGADSLRPKPLWPMHGLSPWSLKHRRPKGRLFIEIWAAPWIAHMLDDARQHPESVLDSARQLLEAHASANTGDTTTYLATWKRVLKEAIPKHVHAREFGLKLARLDMRSQRKNESIRQDIDNLRDEMRGGFSTAQELDAAVDAVRRLYVAGMATMRLCAMASHLIPEDELLAMVAEDLNADRGLTDEPPDEKQHSRMFPYWIRLDHHLVSVECDQFRAQIAPITARAIDALKAQARACNPTVLLAPFIEYRQGCWHLYHAQNDLAEQCFTRVVAAAGSRQLGECAANAASILMALRLSVPSPLRFEELNPLIRVRIENMRQSDDLRVLYIPTPFSNYSARPNPSLYDSHLMQCVTFFNKFPRVPGISAVCNPLHRFDAALEGVITKSREAGARLTEVERTRSAIAGTSVKPYQLLLNHLYYRDELSLLVPGLLPSFDAFARLPQVDQLRALRFVDPDEFERDLKAHGLGSWRHPDEP